VKIVRVATTPSYEVRIGCGLLASIDEATRGHSTRAVLTDENVARLHGKSLAGFADVPLFALEPGEDSKTFVALERVLEFLARNKLDRGSVLVALGGGVVGDVGGLAAALYMRGIAFVQAPTTLLAQVDSSVGGKTAVNLTAGKNLAGAFHQPSLVIADTTTLATLPDDEFRSGLGEVVKTALLAGEHALAMLEDESKALLARDPGVLTEVVHLCVSTKASIVARDPHEKGRRKLLNLGHTFGHAIEHSAGYGKIPHGVAVVVGVQLALAASRMATRLADKTLEERIARLLDALDLPASLETLSRVYRVRFDTETLVRAMRLDKKSNAGEIRLVLPVCAGEAIYDVAVTEAFLADVLAKAAAAT
jgi:3-dehydroquinate synthase